MRNLLALFAFALLTVLVVGWYLDWYSVRSTASEPGRTTVHIDIDQQKIREDLERGRDRLHNALERKPANSPASKDRFKSNLYF